LRSGAFAPDSPVVIFVVAFGDCLQIPSGASTALASPVTATPCYQGLWFARYKTCVQGRGFAGSPGCCRPDGGNPAYERWDVGAVCACALAGR